MLYENQITLGLNDCGAGTLEGVLYSLQDKGDNQPLHFLLRFRRENPSTNSGGNDEASVSNVDDDKQLVEDDIALMEGDHSLVSQNTDMYVVLMTWIPKGVSLKLIYRRDIVKHFFKLLGETPVYEVVVQKREDIVKEKILGNMIPALSLDFYTLSMAGEQCKVTEQVSGFGTEPVEESEIVVEGVVDESFAFDQCEQDSGCDSYYSGRECSALPPVESKSSIKEQLLVLIFSSIWQEICPLLRPVLRTLVDNIGKQKQFYGQDNKRAEDRVDKHRENEEENLSTAMMIHSLVLQQRKTPTRIGSPEHILSQYSSAIEDAVDESRTQQECAAAEASSLCPRPSSVSAGYITYNNTAFAARPKPTMLASKQAVKGIRNSVKLTPLDHTNAFSSSQGQIGNFHHSTALPGHLRGTSVRVNASPPSSFLMRSGLNHGGILEPGPNSSYSYDAALTGGWEVRPVSVQSGMGTSRLPPLSVECLSNLPSLTPHFNPVYDPFSHYRSIPDEGHANHSKRSSRENTRVMSGGAHEKRRLSRNQPVKNSLLSNSRTQGRTGRPSSSGTKAK